MLPATLSSHLPQLTSARLVLGMGQLHHAPAVVTYYRRNRAYLEPFEPPRPPQFYTEGFWRAALAQRVRDFRAGQSLKLLIFRREGAQAGPGREVIGAINFNSLEWGVAYEATLGYSLGADYQGQGYMHEAAQTLIDYGFDKLNLHRIVAAYMPHNQRSANVLARLGFEEEGRARGYLFINGDWQDHIVTSRLNPRWRVPWT